MVEASAAERRCLRQPPAYAPEIQNRPLQQTNQRISLFSEHGRVHNLQDVRRLPPPTVPGLQRQQEVGPQEPLHHRIRRAQVHELRRSRSGSMQRVLVNQDHQQRDK